LGEIGVGDFQAALGFVDHVVEIVFERNAGHRGKTVVGGRGCAS
jgi:hypothetical protein